MIDPVLVSGIAADGIAASILTAIWCARREIRGRLLPLCVLTLLHALLVPLMLVSDALHARFAEYILGGIYLFSTPVLLVFIILYSISLSNRSRMTRLLEISTVIFIINLVVQALLAVFAWGHSQGG